MKDYLFFFSTLSFFFNSAYKLILLFLISVFYDNNFSTFWLLYITNQSFIFVFDSSIGPTYVRTFSNILNNDKVKNVKNELINLIKIYNSLYYIIGAIFSILLYPLFIFLNKQIINLIDDQINLALFSFLLVVSSFLQLIIMKGYYLMQGLNNLLIQKQFDSIQLLFRIIINSLIFICFKSFELILLVDVLISITFLFKLNKSIKNLFNEKGFLFTNLPGYSKKTLSMILNPIIKSFLMSTGGIAVLNGNAIIISQFAEPRIISLYLFTEKIFNILKQVSQLFINSHLPKVYIYFAKKNKNEILKILTVQLRKAFLFYTIISLTIIFFGNNLFSFFELKFQLLHFEFLMIFYLIGILEIHHSGHAQIYMSTNKIPFLLPAIYSGILMISISYILAQNGHEIIYFLLTQLFVQLSLSNWYPVYKSLKLLNISFKKYINKLIHVN